VAEKLRAHFAAQSAIAKQERSEEEYEAVAGIGSRSYTNLENWKNEDESK